jgi:hypothetical protein
MKKRIEIKKIILVSCLLHVAVDADNEPIARYLIEKGAELNAVNRYNWTPLLYAKGKATVNLLIEKGADINQGIGHGNALSGRPAALVVGESQPSPSNSSCSFSTRFSPAKQAITGVQYPPAHPANAASGTWRWMLPIIWRVY